MSWSDEYLALVNQKKKKEKATQDAYRQAIRGGFERKRQKEAEAEAEKQSGYFAKGAFDDGYQFGDVLKTLHGTAKDIEQNLVAGALNIGEGFVDTAAMLAEGAAHLIGDKTTAQGLKDFRGKNIIDEQAIARMIVGGIPGLVKPVDYDDTSVLGDRSDRAIQSLGQMAATAGLAGAGVPWQMTTGITTFGSASEQAAMENAGYGEAALSSLISAGAEILSESLFGGSGLGEKGLINVDGLTRGISNRLVKVLADYGLDMATEGAEEVFSEIASNLGSALYKEENLGQILASQEALDGYLESFVSGALIGGGMNLGKVVNSAKTNTDYRTGLNETEQKVFDKLYKEASEGKTKSEQSKIYDELMEKMEKGYISVESIEDILGDKASVEALQAESDEFNKLYNTASNQLSKAQSDRLAELEAKQKATPYADAVKNAKGEMSQKVYEQVKGTKLEESYREKARRGQAFQADVSRYDAKQQALVKKAMDSGVLNNTRRTHEFVDMIAKIGAEKGISFDFTNNEKLKASGFALDGKTVNGFVSGGNVTLNIHSAKALNSVVGHEITHVLEGTELYDSLKKTLFDYAKTKGEYQGRYDALAKLYENVKDANIEGELVADLVGDYIFSDADFVKNLSTGNRNVFQKIFDEIKYLCKVATKGSKEARELEKLKKVFEEAYRSEITEAQNEKGLKPKEEIQYSLARDAEFSDNAIALNEKWGNVSPEVMEAQKEMRNRVAEKLKKMVEKGVALPEDIEGNTFFSNSSYGGSEENTTICPRSLASEAFVDAVSEYLGRPLSVDEQIYISQDLQGRSMTPECTYCYVATDRKAYRAFLGEYIKQRDAVLEKLKADPKADVSENGALYKEFLDGRKPTKQMYKRFKMWVDAYKNGTPMVKASHLANINKLMGDLNEFGKELKPQIVDAMDYAQKASWAKKRVSYVAYNGHILKWKQDRINKLNSHYGLRMYSFSDFSPAFVLENMQMVADASVRGLKMLGYTKDMDFARIFAPSGMNINISTFGFESGGKVYENNLIGAAWEEAKALRAEHPNVGITFVATNDATVRWAMEQDWIDVVIPYHLVRTGTEVAKAFGYTNYTAESADTKAKEWKKGDKASIAPTEHNNDLETYLKALKDNNLEPRFKRFMTNEDGTPNPNYMKLVNECRQSASESQAVQPKFNEDAAMEALAKLEANGYYNPIGGTVDRMYEIAAEVAENMTRDIAPTQFSLSQQNAPRGKGVYGEDIMLAPVKGTVAENATVVPEAKNPPVTPGKGGLPSQTQAEADAMVNPEAKAKVEKEYQQQKKELEDRNGWISKKASELYDEIRNLKKGVKASRELAYLLDSGYDWSSIRSALVNIKHTPDHRVNMESSAESMAREMLSEAYEDKLQTVEENYRARLNVLDEKAQKEIGTVTERVRQKRENAQRELDENRRLRDQSFQDYEAEIARLQAQYDAKKKKNTLAAQSILRSIERLKRLQADSDANYSKRISDLEKRVEKLYSEEYSRAEHRREKQEGYTKLWKDIIGDTSTWRDMAIGLQYKTRTLRRILRKVVKDADGNADIQKADRIYDEMETKYDHNEALLKKESQKLKQVFRDLNLNHTEDTYAQMLGELRYNPETTLSEEMVRDYYNAHKNKIDSKKVDKAISESRRLYDDLIVRVNKVLKEQGFKEIPYRQGYFPHFTNPKQNWMQRLLNWKPVDNEIPTSIAGLTETFKPQRSWQAFDKRRFGDTTDYSLQQGLDTYIHGALDWIYHIEDLQKRRALENYIRYTHSDEGIQARIDEIKKGDYDADEAQQMIDAVLKEGKNPLGGLVRELMNRTNTLANKKAAADRAMEDETNRKIYSTMTNLNNRITANMVVGSVSSALTNFIPLVQSWHQVSPVYTVRGLGDMVRSTINDDGMIAKSDFLTNRLMEEEKLYKTGWDKVSDKAAILMNAIDNITSQTVWRSKYLQNLSEGMSETDSIRDADQFAKNLIAGRSRGNAPTVFDAKNPVNKLFTAFQLEVANQYGYMFEDLPVDSVNKTRLVKGYATAFLGAYLYNALYSSLVGREAAFDPIRIIQELIGDLEDEEKEAKDIILGFGENILQEVPFVGGLLGGGRVPISSALPYSSSENPFERMLTDVTEGNLASFGKELLKPLYYLLMPVGGGQIKKTVEGLGMFIGDEPFDGSYTNKGDLRYPVAPTPLNVAQAALFGQYANKNAREYFDEGYAPIKTDLYQFLQDNGVSYEEYRAFDEDQREAWNWAKNNPTGYVVAKAVAGDPVAYKQYTKALSDLKADKDENGKSISGSRKEKVLAYINGLDASYGEKIVLYKMEYPSDDRYNRDILEYIKSRTDLSYQEKLSICKELGFTVRSDGYVTWD